MANSNFRIDDDALADALDDMNEHFMDAVMVVANNGAQKFEAYAKQNKRWKNRTSRAWKTLTGYVTKYSHSVRVYIAHGVMYGIYLELAHEKKYAILEETIKKNSKWVLDQYEGFLETIV